jgi:hypothetical protein
LCENRSREKESIKEIDTASQASERGQPTRKNTTTIVDGNERLENLTTHTEEKRETMEDKRANMGFYLTWCLLP